MTAAEARAATTQPARTLCTVPILLYHMVGDRPSQWIAPFTVTRKTFDRHMALLVHSGRQPVSINSVVDARRGLRDLPERPVAVTFDDGYADTLTLASPTLERHGIFATVYVTTAFVGSVSPGGDKMLDWTQLHELRVRGHDVGAHSVTHPQLDLLARHGAEREITESRTCLEQGLGVPVRTFAYPHGYSSPTVRSLVAHSGFDGACSVKNARSGGRDGNFSLSRLMVTARTSDDDLRAWLSDSRFRVGQGDERHLTRGWRAYRRLRSFMSPDRAR